MDLANLNNLDVERIWSDARTILDQIGLEVANDKIKQAVAGNLPLRDDRVCIPREVAGHYAAEIRERLGVSHPAPHLREPSIFNSPLATHWVDPADGRIKPYDTESVIRNTKLTCQLADEGAMSGQVSGVPGDVPPEMRFVTAHYINCIYNRNPGSWSVIHCEPMMPHFLDIAEVMGMQQFVGAEMISPLKFMGQSIDLAIDYGDKGVWIAVDPMPIMGVTAPMDWHAAWAQSVAENVGSYAIFREYGLKKVGQPSFRLFLPNMMAATAYFSSPQHIMALLARRKVREFFGLTTEWAELLLATSKIPDQQAAIEKLSGCLMGRLYGFNHLEGAGGLWMDEIFSPQQLIIDVEIKRFVEGIRADFDEAAQDIVAVMTEGMEAGGFLAAEGTLGRYRDFLWDSSLFDMRPRGAWDGDHETLLKKATRLAEEKTAACTYELGGERREGLERIMARVKKEFGSK